MTTSPRRQYKAPPEGKSLMSIIVSGCKTPVLDVKFSNLIKPFFYPNSPTIPRFSITCVIDPKTDGEFLSIVQKIEREEKVESVLKDETTKKGEDRVTTGKILLKFQSKNKIPVFVIEGDSQPEEIDLNDELAAGEKIYLMYDILRYTKRNPSNSLHGISFKPTAIYYFPKP